MRERERERESMRILKDGRPPDLGEGRPERMDEGADLAEGRSDLEGGPAGRI
jgi:hypothetical protein